MTTASSDSNLTYLQTLAALVTSVAAGLAIYVWLHSNNFAVFGLSAFAYFPVFGLLAFSIMWSQYMVAAAKQYLHEPTAIRNYFKRTSFVVLICILLHPAILISKLYADGAGLPPGSYSHYVAPGMTWIVGLGTLSLLMFIAYEFRNFFERRSLWEYVAALNDAAMLAIFYHGLRLGGDLQAGWFQLVWYVYGITLVLALGYKYYFRLRPAKV